jgi:hypothetical protein
MEKNGGIAEPKKIDVLKEKNSGIEYARHNDANAFCDPQETRSPHQGKKVAYVRTQGIVQ